MAHRNYFRRNDLQILELATCIQRLKITSLGANCQLFRLERISQMFIFCFVYTKHQVLLICNENNEICVANLMIKQRFFPLKNKYFGVFVLNGLRVCNVSCLQIKLMEGLMLMLLVLQVCRLLWRKPNKVQETDWKDFLPFFQSVLFA